jgi:SAM-dependent methyltransferase
MSRLQTLSPLDKAPVRGDNSAEVSIDSLPQPPKYAEQLAAFHRAFAGELRGVIMSLPIVPHMRVLDVACGDGFYLGLLGTRLSEQGSLVGLDVNPAFLELAREHLALLSLKCSLDLTLGSLAHPPLEPATFDFAWCAQSLFTLPEPVNAIRQMARLLRPGGVLAVLENDSLHQLVLPWPGPLEIALRVAEYTAHARQSPRPEKFYIGRRLPAVFAEAGLEPLGFRTQCIDRQAPLGEDLERFLQLHLERLARCVGPLLDARDAREFERLIDPAGNRYLLHQPWFTMTWLNVLSWGRRPLESD